LGRSSGYRTAGRALGKRDLPAFCGPVYVATNEERGRSSHTTKDAADATGNRATRPRSGTHSRAADTSTNGTDGSGDSLRNALA